MNKKEKLFEAIQLLMSLYQELVEPCAVLKFVGKPGDDSNDNT